MFTFPHRIPGAAVVAGSVLATFVMCTAAGARDSVYSLPCVTGTVAGSDYSELGLNFRDGIWSMRKGVELVSEAPDLTLAVLDLDANSACTDGSAPVEAVDAEQEQVEASEEAPQTNTKNRCNFRSNIGTKFIVRVDNTQGTAQARYRLCPY